jgi:hypothetical protein
MNTGFTEKVKKDTLNLNYSKSVQNYRNLITNMNEILKNTKPLSTGYSTRAINHAIFSKYPKTRYFVGWDARATWLLRSIFPDRVLDAMYLGSMSSETDQKTLKEDNPPLNFRLRVNNQF